MKLEDNTLYYGDCLEVMADWPNGCVDLIYLDPPFNSDVEHNIIFGSGAESDDVRLAQTLAFSDTWNWDRRAAQRVRTLKNATANKASSVIRGLEITLGESGMLAYVSYMAERLVTMNRLLKETGSIYLHCDPTAGHYLKILMDAVFGGEYFRNEIVWKRTSAHSDSKTMGAIHDSILFYTASDEFTFNTEYVPYADEYIETRYKNRDEDGRRWMDDNLTAKGLKGGGYTYEYKGKTSLWRVPLERMKELDEQNRLYFTSRGGIRIKRYLDEMRGVPVADVWTDIPPINSQSDERCGYPTQKPLTLLERILETSSNRNDLVLDPFCGCGTTVAAAHNLDRRWVGIDISPFAIDLIMWCRFKGLKIQTQGIPVDMEGAAKLAREKPFDFEKWAVTRIPGLAPNDRQVGDKGIDGRGRLVPELEEDFDNLVLAQVKGGTFKPDQLRSFLHALSVEGDEGENGKAAFGVFITLYALQGIQRRNAEAAAEKAGELRIGASIFPRAQLWSIEDYFAGKMPELPAMADPYTGEDIPEEMQTRFI